METTHSTAELSSCRLERSELIESLSVPSWLLPSDWRTMPWIEKVSD